MGGSTLLLTVRGNGGGSKALRGVLGHSNGAGGGGGERLLLLSLEAELL